ncbi:MAG: branched-chain amino acid ABC transporter substrate-binding protein [Pseudomonadota bacterium]|nr:branched-chain amino acid ABC transporter substrate-binding protein [Pseudomonadota bacterium]
MRQFVHRPSLLAFGVSLATLLTACGPSIPDSIQIGVAQPLSGPSAARGQDLLNGAQLAADDLNAAGYKIGGKPVRIVIVAKDDKADKETAKKVAQELVDLKVTAVIGHLNSDITEVAIPVYKAGNIPEFFTSSATELTKLGDGNAFRLVANDQMQALAIASYAGEGLHAKSVAIVHENTAYGTPLAKDIAAALAKAERKLVFSDGVDGKVTEFAAIVAKLKAAPPDVLVAALRDSQLLPLFTQLSAAGLADLPVIVPSVSKTLKVAQAPTTMKAVYATSSAIDVSEFTNGEFLQHFRAKYNSDPVWAAHYAYDAVYVLTDVLRRNDTVDPAVLRSKLASVDAIAPATVTMRFNPAGEQRFGAISVYQRRAGRWEPLMRTDRW